jgi:hypothetical protein
VALVRPKERAAQRPAEARRAAGPLPLLPSKAAPHGDSCGQETRRAGERPERGPVAALLSRPDALGTDLRPGEQPLLRYERDAALGQLGLVRQRPDRSDWTALPTELGAAEVSRASPGGRPGESGEVPAVGVGRGQLPRSEPEPRTTVTGTPLARQSDRTEYPFIELGRAVAVSTRDHKSLRSEWHLDPRHWSASAAAHRGHQPQHGGLRLPFTSSPRFGVATGYFSWPRG